MTTPKWTPGPWRMDLSGVESKHQRVCDVLASSLAERNANARLIAAAPELYAALESLLTHDSAAGPCDVPGLKCDCYERARAALKRARGES